MYVVFPSYTIILRIDTKRDIYLPRFFYRIRPEDSLLVPKFLRNFKYVFGWANPFSILSILENRLTHRINIWTNVLKSWFFNPTRFRYLNFLNKLQTLKDVCNIVQPSNSCFHNCFRQCDSMNNTSSKI